MKRCGNANVRDKNKGGKSLVTVKLLPPFVRCAKAEHVCLLPSIAVTFGTGTSSSIDAGFV